MFLYQMCHESELTLRPEIGTCHAKSQNFYQLC